MEESEDTVVPTPGSVTKTAAGSTPPTSGVGKSSGSDETETYMDEEAMKNRLLKNRLAMVSPQLLLQLKYTPNVIVVVIAIMM